MEATKTLVDEHRMILKILQALETFAERAEREQRVDRADLAKFGAFFRDFVDFCHHGKEEDILFATLAEAGFPTGTGPLAQMQMDHNRGRRLVGRIRELAELPEDWKPTDFEEFSGVTHAYAELLREHIRREDEVLFPMAEEHLSPAQRLQVDELFQLFEEQREKGQVHARLHKLAEKLIERYGGEDEDPPRPGERMRVVPNCCGV
jgi:hemerythrin-like domain-containing protein